MTVTVLHVIPSLSSGGGVQVVIQTLARALDPEDVEFHAVTTRGRERSTVPVDVPVAIHALGHMRPGFRLRDRLTLALGVRRVVRGLRPDVVQLHSGIAWLGLLARTGFRRPAFLLEVHDAPGSGRHGRSTDVLEGWWVRWLGATAVCHSTSVASEIATRWKPAENRVAMIPLAVDTDQMCPSDAASRATWRRDAGISEGAFVAVAIGRFVASKRFLDAVDSVAEARSKGAPAELVLVGAGSGDGVAEAALRGRAERHGISDLVHLVGPRHGADLVTTIGAADVLLSTSEYEGFGLTVAEGMACGLPVVATSVGGVTDLVQDGLTGTLVAVGDTRAMGAVLADLADAPVRRAEWGRRGRDRAVEHFSVPSLATAFLDLYRSL